MMTCLVGNAFSSVVTHPFYVCSTFHFNDSVAPHWQRVSLVAPAPLPRVHARPRRRCMRVRLPAAPLPSARTTRSATTAPTATAAAGARPATSACCLPTPRALARATLSSRVRPAAPKLRNNRLPTPSRMCQTRRRYPDLDSALAEPSHFQVLSSFSPKFPLFQLSSSSC
jgi:hypothetical protein